ncbi:MAG TPA: hypothetical protein VGS57_22975 [Thermoanaerobaculia bacterium]|jgi:hypothetical protein|nr:hypothetical protein [Thermoanaerobaculia bacterium]
MVPGRHHLYFHAPCFDGITSAALLHDFLRHHEGADSVELHTANYHLNPTWAQLELAAPASVVDFLYHPDAEIWFDHHPTTFLSPAFERDFASRRSSRRAYEPVATSCSLFLWRHLFDAFGFRIEAMAEKVFAADRIDSARYESAAEALFSAAPALRINASLAVGETDEYSKRLVRAFLVDSLAEIAGSAEVSAKYRQYQGLRDLGLQRFVAGAHLESDGIVVFVVDGAGALVNRYAPFYYFPDAPYSLGVVYDGKSGKITAMRNPWLSFESVPLGQIMARFGGGGHQRVGSTRVNAASPEDAGKLMPRILGALRDAWRTQRRERPHDGALQLL